MYPSSHQLIILWTIIHVVAAISNLTSDQEFDSSSRVVEQSSDAVDLRSFQQQLNQESLIRLSLVNQLYTLSSDMLAVKQRMMAIAVEGRQFEDKLEAMEKKIIALENENRRMRDTQEQISILLSNATDAATGYGLPNVATPGSQDNESVVAFSAYMSQNHDLSKLTAENVVYDKTWLNTNGVYNTITGFFTAPSSGLFVFSWTNLVAEMPMFDSEILVNGERKDLAKCSTELDRQGFESCSNTVPVVLKKGDLVNIRKVDAILLQGIQWSSFKGWKVR